MIENFTEYRVETSEDTLRRAVAALGFDEPATAEKLDRRNFPSDEAYFDAAALLAMRNSSDEYRQHYEKIRREYTAQQTAKAEEAEQRRHQQELEQAIKACVLTPKEQQQVDDVARERAQADFAAGLISYDKIGERVEYYAQAGTAAARYEKVYGADMNAQIRRALAQARRFGR